MPKYTKFIAFTQDDLSSLFWLEMSLVSLRPVEIEWSGDWHSGEEFRLIDCRYQYTGKKDASGHSREQIIFG